MEVERATARLAALVPWWATSVELFWIADRGALDGPLSVEQSTAHLKFLDDLIETGRFFESRPDLLSAELAAHTVSASLIDLERTRLEWKK